VNTGTSTYESNATRHAQRGTAAHNTIRIDEQDSSEVWSAFRVVRRAKPFAVKTDHRTYAEASHDGYTSLTDPIIHRRRIDLEEAALRITDTPEGKGTHKVEIYFHLHPENTDTKPSGSATDLETTWNPEFNKSIPNRTILTRWTGRCPVQFEPKITF
jgi:uncharacterized heparinase superfamily protein